jgi:hypothetical protein
MMKPMSWSQLPATVVADVVGFCDGHSILSPKAFTEAGVPAELVACYEATYKSDPADWLHQISDADGNPVDQVAGVYCLTILEEINRDLGLPGSFFSGRGARATHMKAQILEHLGVKS